MRPLLTAALLAFAAPALAASETYPLDPNHTFPSFEFPHMGISVWRGKFDRSSGKVVIDRAAKTGTVEVQIDTTSIDFGLAAMDDKAKSEEFFNVAKYPTATYKGKLIFEGDALKAVDGQITLMGVQKPVKLTVNSFKCIPHPLTGKQLCGADAEGEVIWGEFGMKASQWGQGDAGRTKLRIQVEGAKQD
jgi:polyisoprenoid-binding protein YceI